MSQNRAAVHPEDLSFEPIAIMLPRGDPDFGWRLTLGSRVFGSGEIFEIYRKYVCGITPHVWLGAIFTFGGLPD